MEINKAIDTILSENKKVLERISTKDVDKFVRTIFKAHRIFVAGMGRSGLVAKTFAMRLMHLGFETYVIGETTTPGVEKKDFMIACSGSGETETTCNMAKNAKKRGVFIITFTAKPDSKLAKLSDLVMEISAPVKGEYNKKISSQYSGSLFEQALFLFLEAIELVLIARMRKSPSDLWKRHAKME